MKHIFLHFLILISVNLFAQTFDTATNGDTIYLSVGGDYMVVRDTSASGVISLKLIPTIATKKDLQSQLGDVNTRIAEIDSVGQVLQEERKTLQRKKKELQALIVKFPSPPPAPVSRDVSAPTKAIPLQRQKPLSKNKQ